MHKIFVPRPILGVPVLGFLTEPSAIGHKLFQSLPDDAYQHVFKRVSNAQEADIVVAPHEYLYLRREPAYLAQCQTYARVAHKPLLISAYQDDPAPITIDGTIIIRPSAYRTKLDTHEAIMPAYVEDVGASWGSEPLQKMKTPIVAFVGKADFSGLTEYVRYGIRNYLLRHGPERQGLYFRRRALHALAVDPRIILKTVRRKRYSAHAHTIEIPPQQAREEYIRSIRGAHFTLAPRGDGNYSLRFYETLSLGRIPVMIDTDMELPFEDRIDYESCIVRVPWRHTNRIGDYIVKFFEQRNDAEFLHVQRRARNIFKTYLYMPSFLDVLFSKIRTVTR